MASNRHLAAIMFTDITGFSAMMEQNENYAREIRNRHRTVFKEAHSRYEGKILQYYGDGTLSIFSSAAAAVECSVEMQIEFRKEPEVPLRIGIHTGDISYDDEGAYGDGLNIAARIERLCTPGGVFITAKVFDDIKNHAWLTATSLGPFLLRNIHRQIEVFAVTSKGLIFPDDREMESYPERVSERRSTAEVVPRGHKRKGVAFVLALLFGFFGIHRLYLGQRVWGITHLILAISAIFVTGISGGDVPVAGVFGIIALIDAILLLAMPKAEFDYKYNRIDAKVKRPYKRVPKKHYTLDDTRSTRRHASTTSSHSALMEGIRLYKAERYHAAIAQFQKATNEDPASSAIHFNLACCHSIMRDHEDAYYHLSKAVQMGFTDRERIENHEALSFLRERPDFESFVQNGYRVVESLPEAQYDFLEPVSKAGKHPQAVTDLDVQTVPEVEDKNEEKLELKAISSFDPEILDSLEALGDKLEEGQLTREQFELEKKKILRTD